MCLAIDSVVFIRICLYVLVVDACFVWYLLCVLVILCLGTGCVVRVVLFGCWIRLLCCVSMSVCVCCLYYEW